MTVRLAPQQEEIVQRVVRTGRYASPEEVLDAALRRLEEEELVRQLRLGQLRDEIDRGIDQVQRGQVKTFDPVEMKKRVRAALKSISANPVE